MAEDLIAIPFDGADESTSFVDVSANNHTITVLGDAELDTDQVKYGSASGLFPGNDSGLTCLDNADWDFFQKTNGCIELWVRFTSVVGNQMLVHQETDGDHNWSLLFSGGAGLYFRIFDAPAYPLNCNAAWTPLINTWYHILVVKKASVYGLYIGGDQIGYLSSATTCNQTGKLGIGIRNTVLGNEFLGNMDDFRMTDYILYGADPQSDNSDSITPPPASFWCVTEPTTLASALTLHAPSVVVDCTVTPSTLGLTSTVHAPTLSFDYTIAPTTLALTSTLHAPTLISEVTITPTTLALASTLHAPTICFDYTVFPTTLASALTVQTPTICFDYTVILGSALALTATLQTPTMIVISTPGSFSLGLSLHAPTICFDYTVFPTVLASALTLQTSAVIIDYTHAPATFAIALVLQTPEVFAFYVDIPPFMEKDIIDLYSGGAWLWLCEIAVAGETTQRIARNTENITYRGKEFARFNLQIGEQMFSGDGSIPRVTLRIFQDANRIIEDLINNTEGALGGQVKLIRVNEKFLNSPVVALEADYDNLASESDSEWATFTLGIPNPLTQRIPLRMVSADVCPWATPTLFKGPECQYAGGDGTCTGSYEDCFVKGNAVHWGGELGLDANVVRI